MIRLEDGEDWLLLGHADHAALAGEFARHWKNRLFRPPEPFAHVLDAVARHDDGWRAIDALPSLTPEGRPSAFSRDLVGTYDAFEEIDLAAYLKVRAEATETAARRDPYAAVLISMHTVNLLTEQADPSALTGREAAVHERFVAGQEARQRELVEGMKAGDWPGEWLEAECFRRGFEFLQACDSLSLFVGVDYDRPGTLRHAQPTREGARTEIRFSPLGDGSFALDPYPFDEPELTFAVPYRRVPGSATHDEETFREAYREATPFERTVLLRTVPR